MGSRNILIIYPHWPPSNLAGVHRPRLIANFAVDFNWHPIVLTVDEQYYEEPNDPDLVQLVRGNVEVIKVKAFPVLRLGFRVGDIGLRGAYYLYNKALELIKTREIDFIWIPIPSWYTALVGRALFEKTAVPYGIDYIDPWVSKRASYHRRFSKAWWVNQFAKILEPIAIKKASLISGVSTPYYLPAIERNFKPNSIKHIGMPYGFDPHDHEVILPNIALPWDQTEDLHPFIYAGAFLPQSHLFVQALFYSIQQLRKLETWDNKTRLYFLGTGNYQGPSISDYAKQYGIEDVVFEIRQRFPFLQILNFLSRAKGILVIGSTEKHYTASKTFQALLSKKPVFAIFHQESTAVAFMSSIGAGAYVVQYQEQMDFSSLAQAAQDTFSDFLVQKTGWCPDLSELEQFSSRRSAELLFTTIDDLLPNS